jgi:hypothetical protein
MSEPSPSERHALLESAVVDTIKSLERVELLAESCAQKDLESHAISMERVLMGWMEMLAIRRPMKAKVPPCPRSS